MKQQYYVACKACRGETFSMSQVLEAEDEEGMKGQVLNKTLSSWLWLGVRELYYDLLQVPRSRLRGAKYGGKR